MDSQQSSDPPEDKNPQPSAKSKKSLNIPVSMEMSLQMRREGAVAIREAEYRRFVRAIRHLDGPSSSYLAAAWAMIGVAVTVAIGAIPLPRQAPILFALAALLFAIAGGCFGVHRDVNRGRSAAAEELAREMEEALIDDDEAS